MALRKKKNALQAAERHLRQNKVQEALTLLERVQEVRAADLLTLNRICDQLVRHKRIEEAIRYYGKIAAEFTGTGFYPKAIAIHKKILRLHPAHIDSLVRLGELYLEQRLPGEARNHLLHAAEISLKAGDFARAREVYGILVEAEPNDPRHRARLAETRAAAGETEEAGKELVSLAESLFSSGKPGDAEQSFRRAAELLPDAVEPMLGICKSMSEQGRQDEALALLEEKAAAPNAPAPIRGELALHYAVSGREDEAIERLKSLSAAELPAETLMRLFRHGIEGGTAEKFWERMDPVFAGWAEDSAGRVEAIYTRLGTLEPGGHVPALRRLFELSEKNGDKAGTVRALEDLVRAYRAREMVEEAASSLERLREIAPQSSLFSEGAAAPSAPATAAPKPAQAGEAAAPAEAPAEGESTLPVEAEAPAVPLNRNDEEFVAGRLTQAEILEKYGLFDQATDQVREVTEKFPGHVAALERLVGLLRSGGRRPEQLEALVALAVARRASGDNNGAAAAVADLERSGKLSAENRRLLERLDLLQPSAETEEVPSESEAPPEAEASAPHPPAQAEEIAGEESPEERPSESTVTAEAPASEESPAEPVPEVESPADEEATLSAEPAAAEDGRAVVIDFDELDETEGTLPEPEEQVAAPAPAAPGPRVREPGQDMLDEIRLQLTAGKAAEARRRIQTLRLLGYASEALDRLDEEISQALAAAPVAAAPAPEMEEQPPAVTPEEEVTPAAEPETEEEPVAAAPQEVAAPVAEPETEEEPVAAAPAVEDLAAVIEEPEEAAAAAPAEDDLSTITAALESELFADDGEAVVPEAQSEQSLEDVFSAFKRHVAEEVGTDDFRTHYDLGIAYKEMGLMDEAIGEFQVALQSPEMSREASIMLAICHRERHETEQAAEWYRRALEAPGGDTESSAGLRYELAEVLLEGGDVDQALKTFRDVLDADPAYRDVRERVEQLEARSTP